MKIKQDFFSGERPRMAPHLLKESEAQIAQNCDLTRGDIRPLKAHSKVQELLQAGTLRSLYHWETALENHWIASQNDLDFARSPIAGEARNRVYLTGMDEPRVLTTSILSTPFDFTIDFYKLGVPAPVSAPSIAAGYTVGSGYRAYIYTYVVKLTSDDAEEGSNSPIAEITNYGSGNVVLSGFAEPPTQRSIGKIRIYRVASSTSGLAEFLFVGEFDTADVADWSTFTFTDDVADADLGEAFTCEDWVPPPYDLKGLTALPDGSLAGFSGNRVYVSEPFLPHAWPYSYPVDAKIIGLSWTGSALAVLTDENPYLMTGQASAMQTQRLPGRYPCMSKAGIVSSEFGTLYPTDEGIALINYDGVSLLSYEYFTSKQHLDNYYPSTIKGAVYKGKAFFFHVGGSFVIDVRDKTLSRITDPLPVDAVHVSLVDCHLYFVARELVDPAVGNALYKFEGDSPDYLQYTYRSKNFIVGAYTSFSAARFLRDAVTEAEITASIIANAAAQAANNAIFAVGSPGGDVNGQAANIEEVNYDGLQQTWTLAMTTNVTFNFYADGTLLYTKALTDDKPFRLPAGSLYKRCFYEVIGYVPIVEVSIANAMEELDGAAA